MEIGGTIFANLQSGALLLLSCKNYSIGSSEEMLNSAVVACGGSIIQRQGGGIDRFAAL